MTASARSELVGAEPGRSVLGGFPLEVLFVIDSLGAGGAERSLTETAPRMSELGVRYTVVTLRSTEAGFEDELAGSARIVRLAGASRLARTRELRAIIRTVHPAIVHTTLFEADLVGRVAAAGSGVPVLTSLVNTTYDRTRLLDPNVRPLRLAAARALDGWTGRHLTAHFHAVSRTVKSAAQRDLRIPPGRITIIERGRDAGRLGEPDSRRRRQARRLLGFGKGEPLVLTIGRQEFQKGQVHLLEALAMLPQEARPHLLIAGRPGHATDRLRELHDRLGLGDRVRFLGHRTDIPELLAAADMFVFPSLYEGLAGSVIEAMALALPIVASDLPALREVLEPNGNAVMVPAASPGSLASGLRRLTDDSQLRARYGRRSREIFLERFTLEKSVERMLGLYRRIAPGGVAGSRWDRE